MTKLRVSFRNFANTLRNGGTETYRCGTALFLTNNMTLSCRRKGSTDIYTVQIFVNKQKPCRGTRSDTFMVLDYLKDRGRLSVQPDDKSSQFIKTSGGVTLNTERRHYLQVCAFYTTRMWVFVVAVKVRESYCPDVPYQYQKHKNKLQKMYVCAYSSYSADNKVSSILKVYGWYAEADE
jgi:hypothetical protein